MDPLAEAAYARWKKTIDESKTNPAWDHYDKAITETVNSYNSYLALVPGFENIDKMLIKAMVWNESGGPTSTEWATRPMQIGVKDDKGVRDLMSHDRGQEIVMPPDIRKALTIENIKSDPIKNIQAGVGYLVLRSSTIHKVNVSAANDIVREYIVRHGDNMAFIASSQKSTPIELKTLNPMAPRVLHPGDKIKIRKASMQWKIIKYKPFGKDDVYALYNNSDFMYTRKISYCLSIMKPFK